MGDRSRSMPASLEHVFAPTDDSARAQLSSVATTRSADTLVRMYSIVPYVIENGWFDVCVRLFFSHFCCCCGFVYVIANGCFDVSVSLFLSQLFKFLYVVANGCFDVIVSVLFYFFTFFKTVFVYVIANGCFDVSVGLFLFQFCNFNM